MPKIALLVCDTLIKDVVDEHGDYPVLYSQLLADALPNQPFTLDPYDVVQQVYPEDLDKYDAIMLSGSGTGQNYSRVFITLLSPLCLRKDGMDNQTCRVYCQRCTD